MNPITLELYRHRLAGVADEMGVTLRRTAYSPNIKERLDFSCAVFDDAGNMVAQAAHIPAHLGAMPASVQTVLAHFPDWQPGDVVIVNDPFDGGNHLPDITMISPIFSDAETQRRGDAGMAGSAAPASPRRSIPASSSPAFFVASRAHHADVGGMSPGSLPLSTEIYQEGIIIPPVRLYRAGVLNEELLQLILRNVRTPGERRGDLAAQRAAHAVGERRLHELIAAHGLAEVQAYASHLRAYSERLTRAAIAQWPDGDFAFEDVIENVQGDKVTLAPIRVTARVLGNGVTFDFDGTAATIFGSLNTVLAVTQSACYYAVRCLVGELLGQEVPLNAGCFAPVEVTAPPNTLVNAASPAAVAGGNTETSQRVTDVVLGALAQALPELVPAASQGTMNNLTLGGTKSSSGSDGTAYAYYETLAGGMGASASGDGLSGVQVHMTNTLNTPVEALEMAFPFRVTRYALRAGSGGAGRHRGGDGLVREYELLAPATVTMLSERRSVAPWGAAGGGAGATGRNVLRRADGSVEELASKFTRRLAKGDVLRIETPGGGGWGST